MDTTMQDTLLFFDQHKAAYPLYEQLQEGCLRDCRKAGSRCRNPKSHSTTGICMPACPS